jgi:cytochrome b561
MASTTLVTKYSLLARYLHWSMALLIAVQFLTILYVFIQGKDDPALLTFVQGHHASGMLVFVLLMLRIVVRRLSCQPKLSSEHFSKSERHMATIGHIALYTLMLTMPVSGYIIMDASPYDAHFYSYTMPDILVADELTMNRAAFLHWLGAWITGVAILGHITMAIWHHRRIPKFIRRMF